MKRYTLALPFAICATTAAYGQVAQVKTLAAADTAVEVDVVGYNNSVGSSDSASQGSINGQLLETRPLLRPGEVLEYVPGLVVTQHSGDGKANQYFLRGYNLDHGTDFLTSVDGVQVNMPSNAHGQGYADLNFLIPELVDRIDYEKGPYFAENGDFSAAGAARIWYKSVLDKPLLDLSIGDNGYRRLLAAGSMPLFTEADAGKPDSTDTTLLGAVELMSNDGPWVNPEDLRKFNSVLRLRNGTTANGWSGDLLVYDARWNSTDQVPLESIQSGQLNRFGALDPTDGGQTERILLSGKWAETDSGGYARMSAFVEHYQLTLWSDFTFYENRSFLAPNPDEPSDQFEQSEHRNVIGAQAAKGWYQDLFGMDSTTELGLQLRHDDIDVSLSNTQARAIFQRVRDDVVSESSEALYLQNTLCWAPWLRSLLGARFDRISMNVDAGLTPENSGSVTSTQFSPKLALIFGPWDKTEFFADIGRGFHSNDARGVLQRVDPTDPSAAPSVVPAIVPAVGKEIGVRTEVVPHVQSSMSIWSLNSDSELQYNADSDVGSTSANGASRRRGVEWNNHWSPDKHLIVDLDLAWTHARYASDNANGLTGDMIPNAISKVGTIGVTVSDIEGWSGGLSTRYFGPYPLSQDGSLMAPSALVTNLQVQKRISSNSTLVFDILNLFDRQYYDIAYEQDYQVSPTSPVVPSGITVHPGEGRSFRFTYRYQF